MQSGSEVVAAVHDLALNEPAHMATGISVHCLGADDAWPESGFTTVTGRSLARLLQLIHSNIWIHSVRYALPPPDGQKGINTVVCRLLPPEHPFVVVLDAANTVGHSSVHEQRLNSVEVGRLLDQLHVRIALVGSTGVCRVPLKTCEG
jgi:hypothetical protein